MKKMSDENEQIIKNTNEEKGNKKPQVAPLDLKKEKEAPTNIKARLLAKNKKAISMKHIFKDKDKQKKKPNINIPININQKVQETGESRDNSSKPRTDNSVVIKKSGENI